MDKPTTIRRRPASRQDAPRNTRPSDRPNSRDHGPNDAMRIPCGGGYRVFKKALPK